MVDRRHVGVGRHVLGLDASSSSERVLLEQVALERAREDGVVDPEDHVALGIAGRQERSVERLVRVAGLEDPERQPALLLERRLHLLRDREGVVRDSTTSVGASSPPPQPATATAAATDDRAEEHLATSRHHALTATAAPGRIASSTPASSVDARLARR